MKSRRRIVLIICVCLIVLAAAGEYFVSQSVAQKLVSMVQTRANAQLQFSHAWYVPPFGMHLSGVKLTREGQELLSIPRLDVRLDGLPKPHQQLVISSIDVCQPVVRILPNVS